MLVAGGVVEDGGDFDRVDAACLPRRPARAPAGSWPTGAWAGDASGGGVATAPFRAMGHSAARSGATPRAPNRTKPTDRTPSLRRPSTRATRESFAFNAPPNTGLGPQAQHPTRVFRGPPGQRDHRRFLWRAARSKRGWLTRPAIEHCPRECWAWRISRALEALRPSISSVPAAAGGQCRAYPDLRHDAVHDLRGRGSRRRLQGEESRLRRHQAVRRRQVQLGRGGMPRRPARMRRWRRSARIITRI